MIPFLLRTFEPVPEDLHDLARVSLIPPRVASDTFSDPKHFVDNDFGWVAIEARHLLRRAVFVSQGVPNSLWQKSPD